MNKFTFSIMGLCALSINAKAKDVNYSQLQNILGKYCIPSSVQCADNTSFPVYNPKASTENKCECGEGKYYYYDATGKKECRACPVGTCSNTKTGIFTCNSCLKAGVKSCDVKTCDATSCESGYLLADGKCLAPFSFKATTPGKNSVYLPNTGKYRITVAGAGGGNGGNVSCCETCVYCVTIIKSFETDRKCNIGGSSGGKGGKGEIKTITTYLESGYYNYNVGAKGNNGSNYNTGYYSCSWGFIGGGWQCKNGSNAGNGTSGENSYFYNQSFLNARGGGAGTGGNCHGKGWKGAGYYWDGLPKNGSDGTSYSDNGQSYGSNGYVKIEFIGL